MICGHEMGGRYNQEYGTSRNIPEHRKKYVKLIF